MVRLLIYLGLACLACRWITGRWPWDLARRDLSGGPRRSGAEARARNLLGVQRDASRTDILEAHKRLVAMVHPDRGGTNEQVHEANAARDLLLAGLPEQRHTS